MTIQNNKSAREVAAIVLNNCDPNRQFAAPLLDKTLPQTNEKQRATDLVFGTLRNRNAIDLVIANIADCLPERIQKKLLNIIRIAAYELIYTPQTPEYSIVNEAVKNTANIAGKKQSGFVNAVLRQITRSITARSIDLAQVDVQKTLPQSYLTGCLFNDDILPDSEDDTPAFLSSAFSLPHWLITDWVTQFGPEQAKQICFASNRRPSIYLRPNPLKTTISALAELLKNASFEFDIVENSMIRLKSAGSVTDLPGFSEGFFTIQDITASKVIRILNPKPSWRILDLCAAPGTKTIQLAEATAGQAQIIATDIDKTRLKSVQNNIKRLFFSNISIVNYELLNTFHKDNNLFDCVLLDVPCSNTGVLAKKPEVRYRLSDPKSLEPIIKTQSNLLLKASQLIKPNGLICYSTCSIQTAENLAIVENFLKSHPYFELKQQLLTLPSALEPDCDGGFFASIASK